MVLDLVGGPYGSSSLDVLRQGGLLIGAAMDPGTDQKAAEQRGLRYQYVSALDGAGGATLANITKLIEAGRITITIDGTFRLAEAVQAHIAIEERRTTGKIVLIP